MSQSGPVKNKFDFKFSDDIIHSMARVQIEVSPVHFAEGVKRLNERFDLLSHVVVAGLKENGGSQTPSLLRKGIDCVVVSSSADELTALNLHANGAWSIKSGAGRPQVVVTPNLLGEVDSSKVLPVYAKLRFLDRIIGEIPATRVEKIQGAVKRATSAKEKQAVAAEFTKPYIERYVQAHELDLMEDLVADLSKAYGPILRVTPSFEA